MEKLISYTTELLFVDTDGKVVHTEKIINRVSIEKAKELLRLWRALIAKFG